jgi:hypothetical protein
LLDPTYFGDYTAVVAAIPYAGRALPVAVRAFRRNLEGEAEASQSEIVQKLVQTLKEQIPEGIRAIVVADREFASARFFQFLRSIRTAFAIRVDAETWIRYGEYEGALGKLPIQPGGRRQWLVGAQYGQEAREPVNMLVVWQAKQEEPWFIATNLDAPQLAEGLYRKRMKIEHGFRDWKHHLKLKGTLKVQTGDRAQVLIRALAMLYWFLCLVGTRVNRPALRARVSYWGKPSFFFLSLQLFLMGAGEATRAGERVVSWVRDKLWPMRPLPSPCYPSYRRCRLN